MRRRSSRRIAVRAGLKLNEVDGNAKCVRRQADFAVPITLVDEEIRRGHHSR
jgi:hypothetical protein